MVCIQPSSINGGQLDRKIDFWLTLKIYTDQTAQPILLILYILEGFHIGYVT